MPISGVEPDVLVAETQRVAVVVIDDLAKGDPVGGHKPIRGVVTGAVGASANSGDGHGGPVGVVPSVTTPHVAVPNP